MMRRRRLKWSLIALLASTSSSSEQEPSPVALLFLHNRKCGGSTVGSYLRRWLSANGCCGAEPCKAAPYFMSSKKLVESGGRWHCPSVHFIENEYHCLSNDKFMRVVSPAIPTAASFRFISVTVLRHPIDRLISQWWYHGGPGHALLSMMVAERCFNNTSTSTSDSGSGNGKGGATAPTAGFLQRPEVRRSPCYRATFRDAHRETSESTAVWEGQWLDKDPPRLHLFRSLHSNYVDNYFVRRFVASTGSSSSSSPPPPNLAFNAPSSSSSSSSSSEPSFAEEHLSGLRARCNLRGGRTPLTATDLSAAKAVLARFSAVVVLELLGSSLGSSSSGGRMVARLRRALGPSAPPADALLRTRLRQGVVSDSKASDTSDSGEAAAVALAGEGRGAVWRATQVPAAILTRLERENRLDLDLYAWAVQNAVDEERRLAA